MRNKGIWGTFSWLFLSLIFCGAALSVDKETSRLIDKEIEKHQADILKTRRFLHMNPELSNREYETSKLIASKLLSLGLNIRTGVAKTGVVALLMGDQPGITVGIRADMDALPIQETTALPFKSLNKGVMHACGHDIHMSIALGTAMVMNSLKDRINGNIKFIFQPAEEGAPPGEEGGANLMIREGVLEDPPVSAIVGLHVWPQLDYGKIMVSPGPIMASSDQFKITIKGKSSHGAKPHEGTDAIAVAAQVIVGLQSLVTRIVDATDPIVLSVGRIEGGARHNIIAEKVILEGTVRTLSQDNRERMPRLIEDILRGITHSFGADYIFDYTKGPPVLYNHPDLEAILHPTLIGVLGSTNVLKLTPQMVAEDFSYYCHEIPGLFYFLGVKNPDWDTMAPLHSSNLNPDERSIALGIKIMCHLLLDCLDHQSRIGGPSD